MSEAELSTELVILEAAKKVFVQRGFAGARMQEIADEAGINKALLHYYYRSKEKLFQKVFEDTVGGIMQQFNQVITAQGSVLEKLDQIIATYIRNIRKNPHLPLFVLHELSQNRLEFLQYFKNNAAGMPNIALLIQQLFEEQEAGSIRTYQPLHLFLNVISMCVFPFIAKPVFCNIMDLSEAEFNAIMEERITEVQTFVRRALEP